MDYWPGCTTNAGWMLAYRESVRRYFGNGDPATRKQDAPREGASPPLAAAKGE